MLDAAGIEYRLDPHLVRGLDYYTRTVFEFFPANGAGAQDALGGGGRYDGLAEAEGWPATPGVGFASGLDRVIELVQATGTQVVAAPAAEVVVLGDAGLEVAAADVARICRTVRSVAVDYEPKSLKSKMKSANKLGARWVVLLTAAEAARRVAQLKEMVSGEQVEVAWADLPANLA
jgi:histidyl-tRNA synthetase